MLFKNMYRISFETNTGLFWELHRALLRQIEDSFGMSTRFFRDIYRASERCAGLFGDIHSALLRCAQGSCETRGSFGTGKGLFCFFGICTGLFGDIYRARCTLLKGVLGSFGTYTVLCWVMYRALLRHRARCTVLRCVHSSFEKCHEMQHAATRCNMLQYAATHCNTLHHLRLSHDALGMCAHDTATHCNALQYTATH